jgi:hypothetical protein
MPQVAQVIDRHATDVHADMSGLDRMKRLTSPSERVENVKAHEKQQEVQAVK